MHNTTQTITVREKLENMLMHRGMFLTQAEAVMDIAITELNKLHADYKITFDSRASDYPDMLYSVWFMHIKPIALKWIDENKPQAWFREIFV